MPKSKSKVIAVDFDGTCVTHEFPNVGSDIGATGVLMKLMANGHRLMLWTMRDGETLKAARTWFATHGLKLWGINENPEQKETGWSKSNKQNADLYIDDAALGAPLISIPDFSDRPFIDWKAVEKELIKQGLI